MGMVIIVWTIRLSLICFFATLFGWILRPGASEYGSRRKTLDYSLRVTWTLGFMLFLAHVLSAFHFHHQWNHQAAIDETARQTQEMIGIKFGGGVYFNHLFLIIWGLHVVWLWCGGSPLKLRYRQLELAGLLYLVFIAFNGTAVFKAGWLRASGVAAMSILAVGLLIRMSKRQRAFSNPAGDMPSSDFNT